MERRTHCARDLVVGNTELAQWHRFDPLHFEIQGIVPIAYSVFAVSLGVAAGAVLRRTLPALGVTIFGYAAVRLYCRRDQTAPSLRRCH
ncbi:MAG: hypothetical protein ACR2KJ_02300 [Jatrophihabitans sp.]